MGSLSSGCGDSAVVRWCRARRVMEERAAAKSAAVKQQRTRQGVAVGGPKPPKLAFGRHGRGGEGGRGEGTRAPQRHYDLRQQQQQQQASPSKSTGNGGGGRGSKRTRLVEAQWAGRDGQFGG